MTHPLEDFGKVLEMIDTENDVTFVDPILQPIAEEITRIGVLLGVQITLQHHEEPVPVKSPSHQEWRYTRPWTLEIGFDHEGKSWIVALDRVTLADVRAYLSALDMIGHRAIVSFPEAKK